MLNCRLSFSKQRMLAALGLSLFAAAPGSQTVRCVAQTQQPATRTSVRAPALAGRVVDASGSGVGPASVMIEPAGVSDGVARLQVSTDAAGYYTWRELAPGSYRVWAQGGERRSPVAQVSILQGAELQVNLVLTGQMSTPLPGGVGAKAPGKSAEFWDDPNFAVAGVTDWTAVGGHGSDATLRTSEDLARTTLRLQAQTEHGVNQTASRRTEAQLKSALKATPTSYEATHSLGAFYLRAQRYAEAVPLLQSASSLHHGQAEDEYLVALACRGVGDTKQAQRHVQASLLSKETADADRLAGELDEQLGDPLSAVHEEERAVHLDPSEENYFAWGSELLLHRAVWQASQVFSRGARMYPASARMLSGWGGALFANAMYAEASQKLCQASDLEPANAEAYLLMGKVELASPAPLPCIEQRLAQHVHATPDDAAANYLYAMCLQKLQGAGQEEVERLLLKAVQLQPKYAEAYLELGVLSFNSRNYSRAIAYYAKALEFDPTLAEAHYRLGVAYDRTAEKTKAQREFEMHAALAKEQADAVEQQRRTVKQFSVAAQAQAPSQTTR